MPHARSLLLPVLLLSQVALAQPQQAPSSAPVLDREIVPSAGRSEAIVTIPAFGRYAVVVSSEEGTAVQVIDRMTGPGEVNGTPGTTDGRIDDFFDDGEYKIVTLGHPNASGQARIAVRPFREQSGDSPPRLVEHRPVESTLQDLEQRSYWLHLEEDGPVILEAAGRSLADMRLWKDGRWLVDVSTSHAETLPAPGRPMGVCRIAAHLPAGLYLLSAYGGPARAWSEENEETETHAFYLRYGIPPRPAIGREHRTVSPLGFDRFHLPAGSSFVRIDLPESTDAVLEATPFDPRRPFARGSRATIDKNSVMPVAEITRSSNTGLVVTVTAQAGQPYVLQHFPLANQMQVFQLPRGSASDRYWVSTVHSGSPGDHSDATAVFARRWDRTPQQPQQRIEQVAVSAVRVSRDRPWHRRFDIQGATTVLLDVRSPGTYRFVSDPPARYLIGPLMTTRPARYVRPEPKSSGEEWTLEKGLHLLAIEPSARGVAEMSFESISGGTEPTSLLRGLLRNEGLPSGEPAEPLAAAQWPSVELWMWNPVRRAV
ncbi:MAG: hypothetical protein ACOC0J_02415, partial [Myxococcota bacterium]